MNRTAIEIVRELYELTTANQITEQSTGDLISFDDYQYMLSEEIDELANVLGIDLDEKGAK